MKIPDIFQFDRRVIDRLIKSNPSHVHNVKEHREKLHDSSENVDLLKIAELFPTKKEKKEK